MNKILKLLIIILCFNLPPSHAKEKRLQFQNKTQTPTLQKQQRYRQYSRPYSGTVDADRE